VADHPGLKHIAKGLQMGFVIAVRIQGSGTGTGRWLPMPNALNPGKERGLPSRYRLANASRSRELLLPLKITSTATSKRNHYG